MTFFVYILSLYQLLPGMFQEIKYREKAPFEVTACGSQEQGDCLLLRPNTLHLLPVRLYSQGAWYRVAVKDRGGQMEVHRAEKVGKSLVMSAMPEDEVGNQPPDPLSPQVPAHLKERVLLVYYEGKAMYFSAADLPPGK